MTIQIPNTFVAGTRARAEDVNENFNVCKNGIDANTTSIAQNASDIATKQDSLDVSAKGNIYTSTSSNAIDVIAPNTSESARKYLSQLNSETSWEEIESNPNQPAYVPYSVNNGLTSINKIDNTTVSFTGTPTVTFPSGKTYTDLTLNNVTGISADGTYSFIIEETDITDNAVTPKAVLTSFIDETTSYGSGGSDGNYNLNIQVKPLHPEKNISGTWTETQFLKLGEVTKTSGTLGTPIVYAFNGLSIVKTTSGFPTTYSLTALAHNIGSNVEAIFYAECINPNSGYSIGDLAVIGTILIPGADDAQPSNSGSLSKLMAYYTMLQGQRIGRLDANAVVDIQNSSNFVLRINVKRSF